MLKVKMYNKLFLHMFEDQSASNLFGCKRHELIGIVEITLIFDKNFQYFRNIIGIVHSRRLLCFGYVAWMREANSCKILVHKALGNQLLERWQCNR
jgi:hypothetical protein